MDGERTARADVRVVVRDVVAEIAPEELFLLDGFAALDDAAVLRRLRRGPRREPLGFGLGDSAALAVPVVWIAVDQAARRFGESAANGVVKAGGALLRRILRRRPAAKTVPALDRDQLGQVRSLVLEVAASHRLSEARATAIADAVVVRLALEDPQQPDTQQADPRIPGPAKQSTASAPAQLEP